MDYVRQTGQEDYSLQRLLHHLTATTAAVSELEEAQELKSSSDDIQDIFNFQIYMYHWCLATLISRIYKTRLTGSEL